MRVRVPATLRAAFTVALSLCVSAAASPAIAQRLTLDQVVNSAAITGSTPSALAWSPDSRTLAFGWDSAGRGTREVWLVARDGSGRRALRDVNVTMPPASARELDWRADAKALYVLRGEQLLLVDAASGAASSIAAVGREAHDVALSPDGRQLAYVRDGDVWTVGVTASSTPRRLTTVSVPSISTVGLGTYARLDREIGTATWASAAPTISWAPDSRTLAVHLVDRRNVRRVPFPSYLGQDTQSNELRRSYPGDENESRQVAWLDVATGTLTPLPLDRPTAVQILNFAWSADGVLLVDRESDDATERWVHTARVGATPVLAYADRRDSRIYTESGSAWSLDGRQLLLTTDRDDRYRAFAITPGDTSAVAITPATSDVQGAVIPLAGGAWAWIANAPDPSQRQLWRAAVGQPPVRVTQRAGTHRITMAPDGATAASIVSDDVTPAHLILVSMQGGVERRVTPSGGKGLTAAGIVAPRYVQYPGAGAGETLHAKVWLPEAARRGKRVPVVFGPVYSNTVRNRWGGTYGLLQQLLVQRGYAVLQVDVRGSTGYGRAMREAFLFEWGGRDLDDLEASKHWLGTQPWANTSCTGIFGSSYGGLITVYSLFKRPGLFRAGVAGASATDPRFFGSDDVAITRRPDTHPEAFRRGALQYAAGLTDHLMLIHGLQDDVVPFKTTADLAEELMRLNKDFDLVVAPGATHGWTARPQHARYLLGKLVSHFDRYLCPAP